MTNRFCRRRVSCHVKHTDIWTPTQKADLLDQRTRLHRQISRFKAIQTIYMPPATVTPADPVSDETAIDPTPAPKRKRGAAINESDTPNKPNPVELQPLLLPSELPVNLRSACYPGLEEIERKMRDAQCRTSLDRIRTHLYMKSGLTTYKQRHARHQKGNTRTHKTIDDNDMKIKIFQEKYNTARKALIALGANEAEMEWKEVKDADLRCLEDAEMDAKREERRRRQAEKLVKKAKENALSGPGPGESHRKLSWIWEGAGRDPDTSTGLHEGEDSSLLSRLDLTYGRLILP
jgi:hypothetical protein